METQNEREKKHLEFKKKVIFLVALEDKTNKLFKEGKIKRKKKKEIKKIISLEWDKAYNRHPYILKSIKQGFNLLYASRPLRRFRNNFNCLCKTKQDWNRNGKGRRIL